MGFSRCMEAIDCKMNYEMRVEEHSNPLVVFMHQMIPHHENSVNMARIALKHAKSAEGFNDEELDVPALLREIINTQNKQIQDMQGWLERYGRKVPNIAQPLPKVVLNDSHFLCSRPSFPLPFCSLDEPTFCASREFLYFTKMSLYKSSTTF